MNESNNYIDKFNTLIIPSFRNIALEDYALYAPKDATKESFNEMMKFYTHAFLFNIAEIRLKKRLDHNAYLDFREQHIELKPKSLTGENYYIGEQEILSITMSKDGDGRLYFAFKPNT